MLAGHTFIALLSVLESCPHTFSGSAVSHCHCHVLTYMLLSPLGFVFIKSSMSDTGDWKTIPHEEESFLRVTLGSSAVLHGQVSGGSQRPTLDSLLPPSMAEL